MRSPTDPAVAAAISVPPKTPAPFRETTTVRRRPAGVRVVTAIGEFVSRCLAMSAKLSTQARDTDEGDPKMSSFDANDFRGIKPIEPSPVETARRALSRIKAPTKRAAFIAATIVELPSQTDVIEFVTKIRHDAGVQDAELLPANTWHVTMNNSDPGHDIDTGSLREMLSAADEFRIDFPNVYFHWGYLVTFTMPDGREFRARSADWSLTETYLSS